MPRCGPSLSTGRDAAWCQRGGPVCASLPEAVAPACVLITDRDLIKAPTVFSCFPLTTCLILFLFLWVLLCTYLEVLQAFLKTMSIIRLSN